jgi:uncharacterized protein (TIGR03086 family)
LIADDALMTTTRADQPTTDAGTTDTSSAPVDARPQLRKALRLAGTVIDAVRPDQLALPTSCDEFDVERMRGHLLGVALRVAAIGRGEGPFNSPDVVEAEPDEGWTAAWVAASEAAIDAWAPEHVLTDTVQVPWTTMPGWDALTIYVNEVTVHTWDLATAIGLEPVWDDAVLDVSLQAMVRQIPDEHRTEIFEAAFAHLPPDLDVSYPFGPAVPIAADAPFIDRLVAYNGRDPRPA